MNSVRVHVQAVGQGLTKKQLKRLGFSQREIDQALGAGEVVRRDVLVSRPRPTKPVFDSGKDKLTPSAIERIVRTRDEGDLKSVRLYSLPDYELDAPKVNHDVALGDVYVHFAVHRPELIWRSERDWAAVLGEGTRGHVVPDACLFAPDGSVHSFIDAVTSSYRTPRIQSLTSYAANLGATIQLW